MGYKNYCSERTKIAEPYYFVIAFHDVGIELYCNEDNEGSRTDVMRFDTYKEAEAYFKLLDSREFDRFILRLNDNTIKRYEKWEENYVVFVGKS